MGQNEVMGDKSQAGENTENVIVDGDDSHAESEVASKAQSVYGWLTVAGSFLVYFVAFGFMNSFGYFQNYYQQNNLSEWSPSIIALIGSMQLGLMYIIGPVSGAVFDAYGHRWLYLAGAIGAIISCLSLSFAEHQQIWQHFLSQGLLFGLTVSFGTTVALALTSQHFEQNRALALGITATGSSAGGVCFPIIFARLVPKIGFRWTMRVMPLFFIFCYGIAILISRPKNAPRSMKSFREIVDFGGYKDVRYAVLALATVIGNLGLYVPYNYMEPYFNLHFPEASIGAYTLTLVNAASFVGRVAGGLLADKFGTLNVLYPITTICGVFSLTMWLCAPSWPVVVAFIMLYGICSGVYISVMPSIIVRISPVKKTGARLGAFFSLSAIGVFTGTPIGGAFLQKGTAGDFQRLIAFSGSTMAGAGLLLFVARLLCERDLRTKW